MVASSLPRPRGVIALLLGLWLLFTVTGLAAASDIEFKAERRGNAVELQASVVIAGDIATIWRVLTDYGRYAQFVPGMASSEVVRRQGNSLVVEQRGEVNLLWVRRPMQVTLAVTEEPLRSVESSLIAGNLKQMSGRYALSRRDEGVQLVYSGRVVPHDEDVSLVDLLAIRGNTSRQFTALVREIERVLRLESNAAGN